MSDIRPTSGWTARSERGEHVRRLAAEAYTGSPLKVRLAYSAASGRRPEVWTVEVNHARTGAFVGAEPFNDSEAALACVRDLHLLYAARNRRRLAA